MPRPKLTKEGIDQAVRFKRAGVLDKDIAAYIGVSAETFSRWINHPKSENQAQLAQAMKKEEASYKAALLTIIYNEAVNQTWQAAAWLLERKYPDEYARKDRATVEAKVEAAPAFYFSREDAEKA